MLHFFKAISVFSLWVLIALTSHYFISYRYYNTCNIPLKNTTTKAANNYLFLVTDENNNTIYNFSNGFVIKQNNTYVSSIQNIPNLIDTIHSILSNDYTKEIYIIGKYLKNEKGNKRYKNLGLQRAIVVKNELINKNIDSCKIITYGQIFNFSFHKNGIYNNGIEMKFQNIKPSKIDSLENSIATKTLYIDFNNGAIIVTKNLEDYTLNLKQYLQKYSTIKVLITGHTDNLGYYDKNLIIGLNRANKLKEYFINQGIKFNRIKTFSKGESEPIAEKTTEKGRAKNRRIELRTH